MAKADLYGEEAGEGRGGRRKEGGRGRGGKDRKREVMREKRGVNGRRRLNERTEDQD